MASNGATLKTAKSSEDEMDWVDIKEKTNTATETEAKEAPPKEMKKETIDSEKKDAAEPPSELDLVFIVDNTGSMGSWIKSAQDNVKKIIRDITKAQATDVRFALVSYRDHPPQDTSFVTQTHDFTSDIPMMQGWVNEMKAQGGGDGPEAVADGIHDALHLSYRPNSTKVAILIADAPPHGLGCCGDGFPNGCPLGHDPLEVTRSMAAKGITIYTVICGNFEGQAFYQGVAQMTGGQYVPISSAHLLAGVIVGGAQEEISLERLMEDAQATITAEETSAGREIDDDELASRLQRALRKKKGGSSTLRTQFGGSNLPSYERSAFHYSKATTLSEVRRSEGRSHLAFGSYGRGIDMAPRAPAGAMFRAAVVDDGAPSMEQCSRMVYKSKARGAGWLKRSG